MGSWFSSEENSSQVVTPTGFTSLPTSSLLNEAKEVEKQIPNTKQSDKYIVEVPNTVELVEDVISEEKTENKEMVEGKEDIKNIIIEESELVKKFELIRQKTMIRMASKKPTIQTEDTSHNLMKENRGLKMNVPVVTTTDTNVRVSAGITRNEHVAVETKVKYAQDLMDDSLISPKRNESEITITLWMCKDSVSSLLVFAYVYCCDLIDKKVLVEWQNKTSFGSTCCMLLDVRASISLDEAPAIIRYLSKIFPHGKLPRDKLWSSRDRFLSFLCNQILPALSFFTSYKTDLVHSVVSSSVNDSLAFRQNEELSLIFSTLPLFKFKQYRRFTRQLVSCLWCLEKQLAGKKYIFDTYSILDSFLILLLGIV